MDGSRKSVSANEEPDISTNENDIIAAAPGKIILFGEHAVVYKKKAVACALDIHCYSKIVRNSRDPLHIQLKFRNLKFYKSFNLQQINESLKALNIRNFGFECVNQKEQITHPKELQLAIHKFTHDLEDQQMNAKGTKAFLFILFCGILLAQDDGPLVPFVIDVHSDIPECAGLGSSAAFCVSVTTAIFKHFNLLENVQNNCLNDGHLQTIKTIAHCAEEYIHDNSSGIDIVLSTYGGFISYVKEHKPTPINCKNILQLVVINSNVSRSTSKMVEIVRKKRESSEMVIDSIFNCIQHITEQAIPILESSLMSAEEEVQKLSELCRINHDLLNALGVGHKKLEEIRSVVLEQFQMHAKMSGAGGGGSSFILLPSPPSAIQINFTKDILKQIGCTAHFFKATMSGVKLVNRHPPHIFKDQQLTAI
uniref:Mevalonate kinase n=1 Tax=Rhabditophanes sp. KR3021 TaxID=114890 RepID=A0AC35U2K7_9BILA